MMGKQAVDLLAILGRGYVLKMNDYVDDGDTVSFSFDVRKWMDLDLSVNEKNVFGDGESKTDRPIPLQAV